MSLQERHKFTLQGKYWWNYVIYFGRFGAVYLVFVKFSFIRLYDCDINKTLSQHYTFAMQLIRGDYRQLPLRFSNKQKIDKNKIFSTKSPKISEKQPPTLVL
jgi:hypothetical protein